MAASLRSTVRASGLVLLAGAGIGALWWGGSQLRERLGASAAAEPRALVTSPELADATLDRLEALQNGEQDELRLGDAELSSVIRYALPGVLPPGVKEPTVVMRDGAIHLGARLAVAALPDVPALRDVLGLFPDTVQVAVRGTLLRLDGEWAALEVDRIDAAGIPLPARLIPEILTALGRIPMENLPPDALAFPLPHGLRAAFVQRDSLVLVPKR